MPAGSYLDTSFLWKIYITEANTGDCLAWLNAYPFPTFTSDLTDVEMMSSLHRQLLPHVAQVASSDYRLDLAQQVYERLAVNEDVLTMAVKLAEQYGSTFGLRALDAIQLAICVHYKIPEIATFDTRLARAAQAAGLKLSL